MGTIVLTYRCNNDCAFCVSFKLEQELSFRRIHDWVERCVRPGDEVLLTGGEPTVHPDILEIIRLISARGARPVVQTNARAFASMEFCEKSLAAGLSAVAASIYGIRPETHNRLTRSRSYSQTLCGIQNLVKSEGVTLEVRHLLVRDTLNELDLVPEFVESSLQGLGVITLVACEYEESALRNIGDAFYSIELFNLKVGQLQAELIARGLRLRIINMAPCLVSSSLRCCIEPDWLRRVYVGGAFLSPAAEARCITADRDKTTYVDACNRCSRHSSCDGILRRYSEVYRESGRIEPV